MGIVCAAHWWSSRPVLVTESPASLANECEAAFAPLAFDCRRIA
jgi:hypothetical protein